MLTITSKLQMDQCRKEHNLLCLEQHIYSNKIEHATRRLDEYETKSIAAAKASYQARKDSGENIDVNASVDKFTEQMKSGDEVYLDLAAKSSAYETRNECIATEMEVLEQAMSAFEKEHQAGIKEDTTFWCFGG